MFRSEHKTRTSGNELNVVWNVKLAKLNTHFDEIDNGFVFSAIKTYTRFDYCYFRDFPSEVRQYELD